jgi:hypothetical protein
MTDWDGHERRIPLPDGREGRRPADKHCSEHFIIQEATKDHRVTVCGKISNLKNDSERDLANLKEYHDKDLEEIKLDIAKKADFKDLKGMLKLVSILIVICCAIVAGQAVWLKTDSTSNRDMLKHEIDNVANSVQRLNIRVTTSTAERMATDMEQTKALGEIAGELKTTNWRLTQIEEAHKPNNKFIPEKQGGKVN